MAALVTVAEAKSRLRIDFADDDTMLAGLLAEATDHVITYLKKPDHGWTESTVPARIKTAILLVTGAIYENRDGSNDVLPSSVRSLLRRDRDPALA